jgi:hypothetical protein
MTSPEQIDEIQRLLFTLINESRHWYVVIGLIEDKFALWSQRLTQALRSRIQAADGHLPLVELPHLSDPGQKEELIRQRLASPALVAARKAAGAGNETSPLTGEDCRALASGEPAFPRELLAAASHLYAKRLTEAPAEGEAPVAPAPPEPLRERIHLEFRERRERIDPDQLGIDKASLADRLGEAAELAGLASGLEPVSVEVGPLEDDHRFKGTDTVLGLGGRSLRLVAHHIHRGPAFPTFLRQVIGLPRGTLLVRDGAAGISGRVTTRLLEEFRRDKTFLHLPRPAIADLLAMGEILAETREGNFSGLETKPEPTPDNVKAALATLPWVTQGPFARALLEVLGAEKSPGRETVGADELAGGGRQEQSRFSVVVAPVVVGTASRAKGAESLAAGPGSPPAAAAPSRPRGAKDAERAPGSPADGTAPAAPPGAEPPVPEEGRGLPPGTSLAGAVEGHLRSARWLMFERLRLWLSRQQMSTSVEALRAALDAPPLSDLVLRYPSAVASADEVQILVWNGDDA